MERTLPPDPSDQPTVNRKARIDWERVHLLYRQSKIGVAGTLGNAAILSIGLRHQIKPTPLVCWLITLLLLSLVRFFMIYRYPRQTAAPAEAIRWGRCSASSSHFSAPNIKAAAWAWQRFTVSFATMTVM
jgi:hypothetical protein